MKGAKETQLEEAQALSTTEILLKSEWVLCVSCYTYIVYIVFRYQSL